METKMKKWFVLALVTSLAGAALAQSAPTAEKKLPVKQKQKMEQTAKPAPVAAVQVKRKKPPVVKFSMAMLESGRIDPGYTGIPVAEVVGALEKMTVVKKGEFESTVDYNARRSAALAGKFLGDSSIEDILAFVVPVSKGRLGLGYEFNADTGNLALSALFSGEESMNGLGLPNYDRGESKGLYTFKLSTKILSQSTYKGRNAYGATVKVLKSSSLDFGVAADRLPFLSSGRFSHVNPIVASPIKLENSRAAQELPALKALIVMKLADPYVLYHFLHIKPELDNPYDFAIQKKFLTGNVLGIVFYSGLTGEIFARLPDAFGKPEPKIEMKSEDKPASQ